MIETWVDTDFGFDDLWALLLLRYLGCHVAGVSLVAGNAPLEQVATNAVAAQTAYRFDWPLWQGAHRPLRRTPETAERILGPTGMRSRGRQLDSTGLKLPAAGAVDALRAWLQSGPDRGQQILALGPLTNIAQLLQSYPDLAHKIGRLVWMGGSAGAGNHTPKAEFNAVADAEALASVIASDLPLDIVDLTFCRQITFGPQDLPDADPLTLDLVGGYLDIGLERGRPGMAIYDPLAALALAHPHRFEFQPCAIQVETAANPSYGATRIVPVDTAHTRLAVGGHDGGHNGGHNGASKICLRALERNAIHGPRL